jgi:TetR/AcrR family transcriptional regulator, tetracycline repressor protein
MTDVDRPAARRGRPRRVDRDRIVQAAKALDPTTLTMQALADEIGVDRKTLHYHVQDRASLIRMVAADAFRDAVAAHHFVPERDWRKAIHAFATITRDAVIAAGAWGSYVGFQTEEDLEAARPAEAAIDALVGSGLPEAEAGRVVAMVAVLAFASGRDLALSESGTHPQEANLEQVLDKAQALDPASSGQFTLVHRLVGAHSASLGSDEQFAFEVGLVTSGVEHLLGTRRPVDTASVNGMVR